MKKIFMILAILVVSGCATTVTPYINTNKELPINLGTRATRVCSVYLFGIIGPIGNNSVAEGARKAHITNITYYEKSFGYFGLWSESCNNIYGYNGQNANYTSNNFYQTTKKNERVEYIDDIK